MMTLILLCYTFDVGFSQIIFFMNNLSFSKVLFFNIRFHFVITNLFTLADRETDTFLRPAFTDISLHNILEQNI